MKIIKDLLKANPYNFPGLVYDPIRIVIHYTGDYGASAERLSLFFNNVSKGYFKDAKKQINTSCNYIVGYDGTIIQKAEDNQMTYSVCEFNPGSIAIEVCYNSKDGKFTDEAIQALSELVPMLQRKYNIDNKNVVRHYDLTGKLCPYYYVESKRWSELKEKITLKNNEDEKILYRVQVGAFKNKENAENYLKQLKEKGFNGFIVEYKE